MQTKGKNDGELKILWVTSAFPSNPNGNQHLYLWHSLEALKQLNVDPVVLYTPAWKPFLNKGIEITEFPIKIKKSHYFSIPRHYFRVVSNFFYSFFITPRIKKLNQLHQFDIIHAHGEIAGLAAVSASRKLKIPVVVTIHGIDMCPRMSKGLAKKMFSQVFNQANRIVYVGEPLRKHFHSMISNDAHCRIIHNGFRLPTVRQARPLFIKNEQKICIISVSNLHEGKGIDLTLKALGILRKEGISNWHYMIVGNGDQRTYLENLVVQFDLEKQVVFMGDCSHEKVYAHLQKADIFCLPSYREAFGIAWLEAMANGLLTIAVKGQGPQTFIEHGKTGLLCDPENVASLVEMLRLSMMDQKEMQKIAHAGQQHVLENFTWKKHAEKLLKTYREVCV